MFIEDLDLRSTALDRVEGAAFEWVGEPGYFIGHGQRWLRGKRLGRQQHERSDFRPG